MDRWVLRNCLLPGQALFEQQGTALHHPTARLERPGHPAAAAFARPMPSKSRTTTPSCGWSTGAGGRPAAELEAAFSSARSSKPSGCCATGAPVAGTEAAALDPSAGSQRSERAEALGLTWGRASNGALITGPARQLFAVKRPRPLRRGIRHRRVE